MRFNLAANANRDVQASTMQALKQVYGQVRAHDILLQCMYFVKIEDIFNIGANAPWFNDKSLTYLITDTDLSLGSSEAENFEAGSLPGANLIKKTADEMEMTFIETINGDISKSYKACQDLAFNEDGTVNEARSYTFKITAGLINHKNPNAPPPFVKSWLVSVKSGSVAVSATGRSEIVKIPITFQKIRPKMFES